MNDSIGNIPFLYSADAEPSLVNNKIKALYHYKHFGKKNNRTFKVT